MVKCTDCGLMGRRSVEGEVIEALPLYREKPTMYAEFPVCLAGQRSFRADYAQYLDENPMPPDLGRLAIIALADVVQGERSCNGFQPYMEGITPKEHREMLDRQWMEEEAQRRRTSDRRWHIVEFLVGAVVIMAASVVGASIQRAADTPPAVESVSTTPTDAAPTVVLRKGAYRTADFCVTYRVGDLEQPLIVCAPVADHACFSSAIIGAALPRECSDLDG